jgi:HD superfamily phosphohydrolase
MISEYKHTTDYISLACTQPLRDPLWGSVMIPESFMKLIGLPRFQKLASIRQLGPTYLVYPGAVHTRLNHSIGVYEIARRMILSLSTRLRQTGRDLPWDLTGVKSYLAAALLHDLGHFPYTHSLKDLPLASHEALAAGAILEDGEIRHVLEENIGASAHMCAAIIDEDIETSDEQVLMFRSMLSGTLDPDKLDYLNRDAFFCGVPYGQQDVDFILTKLTLTEGHRLAVDQKGVGSIEHLLFSKYLMYRNVYWHQRVRSATAMIRKALYLGLEDGLIMDEDLYGLDDSQFMDRFSQDDFRYSRPIADVRINRLYPLSAVCDTDGLTAGLRDQAKRLEAEERLRNRLNRSAHVNLNPEDVILDIPEPVSFEAEVPVITSSGSTCLFHETEPVFSPPVIRGFTEAISSIRLFTAVELSVDKNDLLEYLA